MKDDARDEMARWKVRDAPTKMVELLVSKLQRKGTDQKVRVSEESWTTGMRAAICLRKSRVSMRSEEGRRETLSEIKDEERESEKMRRW